MNITTGKTLNTNKQISENNIKPYDLLTKKIGDRVTIILNGEALNAKELYFKDDVIQNNINIYKEKGFRRNSPNKIIDMLPFLTLNEFLELYKKESTNQNFKNRKSDYYLALITKLEGYKNKINKKDFKEMEKNIESNLGNFYRGKKESYLDEVIKNDTELSKINILLELSSTVFNFIGGSNKSSYLLMYDSKKHNISEIIGTGNMLLSIDEVYESGFESSVCSFKVGNSKLKKLFGEDIDLLKFLRSGIRGRGATDKLNIILDNLDSELLGLFFMIFKNKGNLSAIEKIKNKIDVFNGKGLVNKDFYRAVKLELQRESENENNSIGFDSIIKMFEDKPSKAKKQLIYWQKTKKLNYLLEKFISKLTENRGTSPKARYSNRNTLQMIISQIEDNTKNTSGTDLLLDKFYNTLEVVEKSIKKQKSV